MKSLKLIFGLFVFLAMISCRQGADSVMARYVPERSDDFVFENDLICGRIYGEALEHETISPGIDVWVKMPGELVADRRYKDDLENGKSYHIDWGDGKDCYKVGRSLGAGASAPIIDGVLHMPETNYRSYQIDSRNADEIVFTLHYPEWDVNGMGVTLDKTITVKAGSYFCSVRDVYTFSDPDASMSIACGVFRHIADSTIEREILDDTCYAIWEHASDQSKEPEEGMLGIGVRMTEAEWTGYTADGTHGVCVRTIKSGEPVTYEFASCWSKADIKDGDAWFSMFVADDERDIDIVRMGDPYVLLSSDGHYYMYGTTDESEGFRAYRSDDLKAWEPLGFVYVSKEESWTKDCFWAPEVYERDGKYYMFFSANTKYNPNDDLEVFRIGVAVSDSPEGPFVDMYDRPVFDPGYPIIDADVFLDDDGQYYLYYSRCCYKHPVESEVSEWAREQGLFDEIEESWVYGVRLKPDFSGVIGDPVLLLCPPEKMTDRQSEWESRSVTCGEANRRWTEGSCLVKRDGIYYMMYSANYYMGENYAIGYAVSDNPLGPFQKSSDNPLIEKNTAEGGDVTGVGHNSVTYSRDGKEIYCVYHGRTKATGSDRIVFISRLEFSDGKITRL